MLTFVYAEIFNHESFAGPTNEGSYQMQIYPIHVTSNLTAETQVMPDQTSIQNQIKGKHKTPSANYEKHKRHIPYDNPSSDTSVQQLKRHRANVSSSTTHVFDNSKQKQGIIHLDLAHFTVYHNF